MTLTLPFFRNIDYLNDIGLYAKGEGSRYNPQYLHDSVKSDGDD